jgi:hypothetical protein
MVLTSRRELDRSSRYESGGNLSGCPLVSRGFQIARHLPRRWQEAFYVGGSEETVFGRERLENPHEGHCTGYARTSTCGMVYRTKSKFSSSMSAAYSPRLTSSAPPEDEPPALPVNRLVAGVKGLK